MTVTDQLFTVDDPIAEGGLLAGRLLQSVQLLRVARHTGHVIPIAGGGLTVLSGRGPGGASNGAGKSSLAESVLLAGGDRQWTRGGAGAKAVGLLFSEKDAQQAAGILGNAAYGYIAAVWLHEHDPHEAPVTVWMRLQREGRTRLQVRLAEGVQFAVGGSEAERIAHADRIWEQLRDAPTHGPDGYSEALFGAAPGSIGYVRNRGADHTPDTGLLAIVDGVRFRPTDLARELIDLCGLADQVSLEQRQRKTQADLTAQLAAEQADADAQFQAEQQQLADIEARAATRGLRDEAATLWRRYLAAGLSYYTSEEGRLTRRLTAHVNQLTIKRAERDRQQRIADGTDLRAAARETSEAKVKLDSAQKAYDDLNRQDATLSTRLDALRNQLAQLAEAKAVAGTTTRAEAEADLTAAATRRDELAGSQQRLAAELTEAEQQLAAARQGLAGQAGARVTLLRRAGVSAVALHDLIDLSEEQRDQWEPRLALLADAVVIVDDDRAAAVNALRQGAAAAGTALVSIDTAVDDLAPRRPGGAGGHPLDRLLTHLAARWRPTDVVPAGTTPQADIAPMAELAPLMLVEDVECGISVVGGFDQPQTGRAARVRAAEERVSTITARAATLSELLAAAQTARDDAQRLLDAVDKAAQHAKVSAEAEALAPQLVTLRESLGRAGQRLNEARQAWSDANAELKNLREQGERAAATATNLSEEITRMDGERQADLDRLAALPTEAFRLAFAYRDDTSLGDTVSSRTGSGGSVPDEATLADADAIAAAGPSRGRLRAQAAAKLRESVDALPDLDVLDPDNTSQAALLRLRAWCADMPDDEHPVPFATLVAPLDQWLTVRGNGDEAIREDIEHLRADRDHRLAVTAQRIRHNQDLAHTAQENAKKIIRRGFRRVGEQLQRMWTRAGRHEIALHLTHTDPASPEEPVTWQLDVTWQATPEVAARRYGDKANTAEYVLVHTLLTAAALCSITNPKGRLIVIDEFGQNLDMVNIPAVADVLKQIADQYRLTIILACQDVAAPLIARHCDALVEVQHVSDREALNRPPHVTGGPRDPEVVRLLGPAWTAGRPAL